MKKANAIHLGTLMAMMLFVLSSCLNEKNRIPPNCYDDILNNGEELVDCGGPCEPCDNCINGTFDPELEEAWLDCGGPDCEPCPPENNGILDAGEEGIDCGAIYGVDCAELCGDGLLNGNEEQIDCGGPDCEPCPTCADGILNQDETGIDCGGENCAPCLEEVDCTNGSQDFNEQGYPIEWGTDCGGCCCPECDEYLDFNLGGIINSCLKDTDLFPDRLVGTWSAGTGGFSEYTFTGSTIDGVEITIVLRRPDNNYTNGVSFSWAEILDNNAINPEFGQTFLPNVITVTLPANPPTMPLPVTYSTATLGGTGSAIVQEAGPIGNDATEPGPGGFMKASFNATLFPVAGGGVGQISITGGTFYVNLQ